MPGTISSSEEIMFNDMILKRDVVINCHEHLTIQQNTEFKQNEYKLQQAIWKRNAAITELRITIIGLANKPTGNQ